VHYPQLCFLFSLVEIRKYIEVAIAENAGTDSSCNLPRMPETHTFFRQEASY
jgi:hypothetical protein